MFTITIFRGYQDICTVYTVADRLFDDPVSSVLLVLYHGPRVLLPHGPPQLQVGQQPAAVQASLSLRSSVCTIPSANSSV